MGEGYGLEPFLWTTLDAGFVAEDVGWGHAPEPRVQQGLPAFETLSVVVPGRVELPTSTLSV